jgi:transposase, IS6 family
MLLADAGQPHFKLLILWADRLLMTANLNNVVEQDHRNVKRRTWLAKGYGSLPTAWRTLRGIEAMDMVRKGTVRWVAKRDPVGQAKFISKFFAA